MSKGEIQVARIAILGPESSGKTTLCRFLARHFNTVYVHEFVRGYLRRGHTIVCKEDLFKVANKQTKIAARRLKKAHQYLFCDTELINLKVWSDEVFGECDVRLLELVSRQQYDLYLLLRPDLPWSQDGIRHGLDNRARLFDIYLQEIQRLKIPFIEVVGVGPARHENVIESLANHFGS